MSSADTLKRLIFKKPTNTVIPGSDGQASISDSAVLPNPYLNARRAWNNYSRSLVSMNQTLWLMAMLALLIALGAVGGLIYIGSLPKFVPYVVEVDKLGEAAAVSRADRAGAADSRVVHATVASFIADARLVTPDAKLQRDAIFHVYSMLAPNDPGTAKMNEWMSSSEDAKPLNRAQREMVSVEIQSAIPQTPSTWQVDWIETVRDRQGVRTEKFPMRALITVYQVAQTKSTTEQQIRDNPLGIYVRDFSWAKQN